MRYHDNKICPDEQTNTADGHPEKQRPCRHCHVAYYVRTAEKPITHRIVSMTTVTTSHLKTAPKLNTNTHTCVCMFGTVSEADNREKTFVLSVVSNTPV